MRNLAFVILQPLALDASKATRHFVSRVSLQSTASNALAPGLGIENTGVTIATVPAGVTIPTVIKRSNFPRRLVHLHVRARVVDAPNTDQAGWLVLIATVVPS
jgi:hypothetical protein